MLPFDKSVEQPEQVIESSVSVPSLMNSLPIEELAVVKSADGESREEFISRAAAILDAYTADTGFEGCSRIWTTEKQNAWSVALISNHAQVGCTIMNVHPDNKNAASTERWLPQRDSLHSHPPESIIRTNAQDSTLSRNKHRKGSRQRLRVKEFSPEDYLAGPGYMVHDGTLYKQDGQGTMKAIGPVGALPSNIDLSGPDVNISGLSKDLIKQINLRRDERESKTKVVSNMKLGMTQAAVESKPENKKRVAPDLASVLYPDMTLSFTKN